MFFIEGCSVIMLRNDGCWYGDTAGMYDEGTK